MGRPKKWQPENIPRPDLVARPDLRLPYKRVNFAAATLRNAIQGGDQAHIDRARVRYEARCKAFRAARDVYLPTSLDNVPRPLQIIEAELKVAKVRLVEQIARASAMKGQKGERWSTTWVAAKARKRAELERELERAKEWMSMESFLRDCEPCSTVLPNHHEDARESSTSDLAHTNNSTTVASPPLSPSSPTYCTSDSTAMWEQVSLLDEHFLAEPVQVDVNIVQDMDLMAKT